MTEVSAYEAKTHLSCLLRRVAKGERITITRHGVPVAELAPPARQPRRSVPETIERLRELRRGVRLGRLSIRRLAEEGRR